MLGADSPSVASKVRLAGGIFPDLRGLTVQQPWGWAITDLPPNLRKDVENRHTTPPRTLIGRWFALHVGQGYDLVGARWIRQRFHIEVPGPADLPKGKITALVKLADCARLSPALEPEHRLGPWATGPVCLRLTEVFALFTAIDHMGQLGWWRVGERARDEITEAWRAAGRAA